MRFPMFRNLSNAAILGSALLIAGWNMPSAHAQQYAQPPTVQPSIVQEQAQTQPGVEILARGPVHEAYAQPYAADPAPTPVVPKAPPPPIHELPPDNKPDGQNVQWIP